MNVERKPPRYDAASINTSTRRPHAQPNEHEKSDYKSNRITRHKYDLGTESSAPYSKNSYGAGDKENDENAREGRYANSNYRSRRYDNDDKGKEHNNYGAGYNKYGRNNYNDKEDVNKNEKGDKRSLSNGKNAGTTSANSKTFNSNHNSNSNNNNNNSTSISNNNTTERRFGNRSDYRRNGENATSSSANATTASTHGINQIKREEPHKEPVNKVVIHYKSDLASGSTWSKEKSGPTFADMVRMRNEAKAKAATSSATTNTSTPEPAGASSTKESKQAEMQHAAAKRGKEGEEGANDLKAHATHNDHAEDLKGAQDDESEHDDHSSRDEDHDSVESHSHHEDHDEVEEEEEAEEEEEEEEEDEVEDDEEENRENDDYDEEQVDRESDDLHRIAGQEEEEEEEEEEDEDEEEICHQTNHNNHNHHADDEEAKLARQGGVDLVMKTSSIGIGVGTDTFVSETFHLTVPNDAAHEMHPATSKVAAGMPMPSKNEDETATANANAAVVNGLMNSNAMLHDHNTVADVINALASDPIGEVASLSDTPIKNVQIPAAPVVPAPTYYVLEIDRVESVKLPANTTSSVNNSVNGNLTSAVATNHMTVGASHELYTFSAQPGKAPSPAITSQHINALNSNTAHSMSSNLHTPSVTKAMNPTPPAPSSSSSSAVSPAGAAAAAMAAANVLSNSTPMGNPASSSAAASSIPSMYRSDFGSMNNNNMRQWSMNNAEPNVNRLGPHPWQNMNNAGLNVGSNNNNSNSNSGNINHNSNKGNVAAPPPPSHQSSGSTSGLSAAAFSAAALSAVANNNNNSNGSHLGNANVDYWSNSILAERAVSAASRFAHSQQLQYNSYPIPLQPHLQAQQQQQQQQQQQLRAQAGAFPSRLRSSEMNEAPLRPSGNNLGFARTAPGGGIWEAANRDAYANYNIVNTEHGNYKLEEGQLV